MKFKGLLTTTIVAIAMTGCVAEDGDEFESDELGFRSTETDFWNWDLQSPGNGEIEVRGADDDDTDDNGPDGIIWDIDSASVSRQVQTGVFEDELAVADNEISSGGAILPSGTSLGVQCTAIQGDHPSGKVYHLVDGTGEIVLTVRNRRVYMGDLPEPGCGSPANQIAFSFKGKRIYAGHWTDGQVVARASERIAKSNPMRRLLLGALVSGECGSAGLPE